MKIDGRCHCGRVSFSAVIDPGRVMVCHCTDCQVLSGAPFRAVVVAPIETFSIEGETRRYVKVAESGNRRAQVFCPECATPLYATAPENPTSVVIRLGCVAQRAELKPAAQIWQHSQMPWLAALPDVPGSAGQQAFLAPTHGVTRP
ncbi:MAG: GFA family protein [Aquabacterium sp.]